MRKIHSVLLGLLFSVSLCVGCAHASQPEQPPIPSGKISLESIPSYTGNPYTVINDNIPFFEDTSDFSYESYAELDDLGRCGVAEACIGQDLMPTEERGKIGNVKPTGWHTVKYNGVVDGNYLYNRCHLIGYQLTAENANEKNLITGTRYMNVEGMLPFEDMVADYIRETGNHVMYRVTPMFHDEELVARGVLMEAQSVEDDGVLFNVFCYNVQPFIGIDYATGDSWLEDTQETPESIPETTSYILNTNTKKFHYLDCSSVADMKEGNKAEFKGTRDEAITAGYTPCGRCKP